MSFHLPDIHRDWPFPRADNPHYVEVASESVRWIESFKLFPTDRQRSFHAILPGLLGSMAYPNLSRAHFRTACDLMNILFAVDDISDRLNPTEAKVIADAMLDALRNPEKERDITEHRLADLVRSFWARALETASSTTIRRFIRSYEDYVCAMTQEAQDRQYKSVRKSMDEYLDLRRYTGAIKPSLDLILLPLEISDKLLDSPTVKELEMIAIELIAVANDIVSFNVEQARGDIHNLVIVLMDGDKKMTVQTAMDLVGQWYRKRGQDFVEGLKRLPSVDDGNYEVLCLHQYAWGLGNWVTANYEWSFESHRFFGEENGEVMKHRVVKLLPKAPPLVTV
ncbi:isoprenoid synthase domain-containing protein [Collybia nuda]|uniref:Terpene synthase n=1 Tax=Collybia nuda TaxID=64659 RepID=A0A9P6CKU1_9AGAR|nr:isoprenoid synthase domain-containing protein [Collybia nuda]